jgi:hypothetical protein
MAEVKRASAGRAGSCHELTERARTSLLVGRSVLEPTERDVNNTDAVACELFRQSAYWSLKGLAAARAASRSGEPDADLWTGATEALVLRTAGNSETLPALKKAVSAASFVEFADMPPEERSRLVPALRQGAEALLAELDRPARAWEMLWLQRVLRIGMVFVLLAAVALGIVWARQSAERRQDIAVGKSWRQSSRMNNEGCEPPHQSCENSPYFFFHTSSEQNPSLEIDLGQSRKFSKIRVVNREDCCADRAVPLIVEVSVDQNTWREVARRNEVFSSWLAEFSPVEARWVRLRVDKNSYFHLAAVRILP